MGDSLVTAAPRALRPPGPQALKPPGPQALRLAGPQALRPSVPQAPGWMAASRQITDILPLSSKPLDAWERSVQKVSNYLSDALATPAT